ncbi:SIS domain-containing protein [Desertivibrio insolitus]|uniref:SIS domain-containing protein n=1 Tax=Herbiconiux sp. SYSU D00978 TaxID=2812562 RepID=UPI001A95CB43|nr:SIS domain-containing protein [Herbiconiux sp. SYSU D00978]
MLGFNKEETQAQLKSAIALRSDIEETVAFIDERGYDNIYFIGAGGTYAAVLPYELYFQARSTLPVRAAIGKELMLTQDPAFGERSIAVFTSVSGTTEDVVEAIEFAKEKGAYTIAFTGIADSPIATAVDRALISAPKTWFDIQLLLFTTGVLSRRGEFEDYEAFADELSALPEALVAAAEQAEPMAEAFAKKHAETDYYFVVGAGNLWGYAYLYSMCVLEEMQWLRTSRVHGAEFFHGSLELIEKDTALLLFKGEDQSRPLMDRVENFAVKYSDDVTVIDTRDYALEGISERFRPFIGPMLVDVVTHRISKHLEAVRGHSLDLRRYYRVVEY